MRLTLDIGFVNTGSCTSKITFLDGEKGILRYRGYPIEQLAESSNFAEVSYLLYNGELPTASQLDAFNKEIAASSKLPSGVEKIIDQFPGSAHPMGVLASAISSLAGFYPEFLNPEATEEIKNKAITQLMGPSKSNDGTILSQDDGKKPSSIKR